MAQSFIGKPISLISHSDVRYRGILAGIDPQASTIQLSNVYSMGTESRRPPQQYIAPNPDPYNYIIFRASEVKDLSVDDQVHQPQRSIHDDPAVLGASAPAPKPVQPPYPPAATAPGAQTQPYPPQHAQPAPSEPAVQPQQQQAPHAPQGQVQGQGAASNRRPNPVHTAAASLETVSRAMGDLRINAAAAPSHHTGRGGGGRRGGRSGGGRGGAPTDEALKVPTTDFDFESSNAKFEKPGKDTAGAEEGSGATSGAEGDKAVDVAYNPQKSFFDCLSSSSANALASGPGGQGGNGGGRGRRGGGGGGALGRNRREEEREKNVATFGEPGGVGLLGPGGYVGGWGGYGRRGGRRGRGGGGQGRGGASGQTAVQARG